MLLFKKECWPGSVLSVHRYWGNHLSNQRGLDLFCHVLLLALWRSSWKNTYCRSIHVSGDFTPCVVFSGVCRKCGWWSQAVKMLMKGRELVWHDGRESAFTGKLCSQSLCRRISFLRHCAGKKKVSEGSLCGEAAVLSHYLSHTPK